MKKLIILFFLLFIGFYPEHLYAQYHEKYRPQFHFSPKKGWIGDPDGLIYYKGLYHLFWWGHAISKDLVHWKQLPYPMQGDDGSFIYFSGSMVVDMANTAGFGDSAMIAVYTMHKKESGKEMQALSYSKDGIHFQFYKGNPVLDIDSKDFRDPQVFWYEPDNRWIMVVALPKKYKVRFYASKDLKKWEYLSEFGQMGSTKGVWECPDLISLPVDGNQNNKKWVLIVGQGPNKIQYFLGNFDGQHFIPDVQTIAQSKKEDPALWVDEGTDFYAARTWRDIDKNNSSRTVWIGWMGNWKYANNVPTKWGKGFESIPRELFLKTFSEGVRLIQKPARELKRLRGDSIAMESKVINGVEKLSWFRTTSNMYEIEATFSTNSQLVFGINLLVGGGRSLKLSYNPIDKNLILDRMNCSDYSKDSIFNKYFPVKKIIPMNLPDNKLTIHAFVDKSSVEIFINGGKYVLSTTTFPSEEQTGVSFFTTGKDVKLLQLKAWKLKSIWK